MTPRIYISIKRPVIENQSMEIENYREKNKRLRKTRLVIPKSCKSKCCILPKKKKKKLNHSFQASSKLLSFLLILFQKRKPRNLLNSFFPHFALLCFWVNDIRKEKKFMENDLPEYSRISTIYKWDWIVFSITIELDSEPKYLFIFLLFFYIISVE